MAKHRVGSNQYKTKPAITSPINDQSLVARIATDNAFLFQKAATNSRCPASLVFQFSDSTGWEAYTSIAQNSHTPPGILSELAQDGRWELRWMVAQNSNTPMDTLMSLSQDEDPDVSEAALENSRLSEKYWALHP